MSPHPSKPHQIIVSHILSPTRSFFRLTCMVPFLLLGLSGCSEQVVYNRSISELNQKAKQLMAQGDAEGAISRLVSAHDLNPTEPSITFNLAVAYQTHGEHEKAIPLLEELFRQKEGDMLRVSRSLAIAYEDVAEQALQRLDPSSKSTDRPTTSATKKLSNHERSALQQEALDAMQKAIQVLDIAKQQISSTQEQQRYQAQIKRLKERVEQVQSHPK